MNVRFKQAVEPCTQYKVLNPVPYFDYDEVLKRYCEVIEVELLGPVALELVTEATHPDNVQGIEVGILLGQ